MTCTQSVTRDSAYRLLWLAMSLCTAHCAHAGTFTSSTTAPAVNGGDIANFAAQTDTDKWFFQTNEEANPSDAAKGQTFITGTTIVKLKALTYKINMVGFGREAGTGNDTPQTVTQTEKKFPNRITSTNAWPCATTSFIAASSPRLAMQR
jgi:hypothetical protein